MYITKTDVKAQYHVRNNSYDKLHMPTQIIKVGNNFFIVDCLHNQIIYNDWLGTPLNEWGVLASGLDNPHALASDGKIYLVVNTEKNEVVSYEYAQGDYRQVQKFEEIGNRPHFVIYDELSEEFYVWSSFTGEMYVFRHEDNPSQLYLDEVKTIPEFDGVYARSFSMDEEYIYIPVVTDSMIYRINRESFEIEDYYPVPQEIGGMVQLNKIGEYFYITISSDVYADCQKATMIRTKDLSGLLRGEYEDLKPVFGFTGVPYYMTEIEGTYYLIHENGKPGLYRFNVIDNEIRNISTMY